MKSKPLYDAYDDVEVQEDEKKDEVAVPSFGNL